MTLDIGCSPDTGRIYITKSRSGKRIDATDQAVDAVIERLRVKARENGGSVVIRAAFLGGRFTLTFEEVKE